jgi:hypothetical protein
VEELNQYISRTVAIFRSAPNLSEVEIYRKLVNEGLERPLAARLVEFVPMAYCRLLLEKSGAQFVDSFQRVTPDGLSRERPLASEPIWIAAMAFAHAEVRNRVPSSDLLAVAGCSAEFQAANVLLHKGSSLQNLAFTPPLLPWPENGPAIE